MTGGLRPRGKPGRCRVEGHGHNGVKGTSREPCSVCAEIPLLDRAMEKRRVRREIDDQRATDSVVGEVS